VLNTPIAALAKPNVVSSALLVSLAKLMLPVHVAGAPALETPEIVVAVLSVCCPRTLVRLAFHVKLRVSE
jgi:hypothetical protein